MSIYQDKFQDIAYSMGYKPNDLLPIEREEVQKSMQGVTKGMTQIEKQFYINKKMQILINRQNNIIREIEEQVKKRQFSYKISRQQNYKLHNPKIIQVFSEHEKLIKKNQRYLNTIFKKKAMEQEKQYINHLTSMKSRQKEKMRATGNSFVRSNASSASKRSNKTEQSKRSNISQQSKQSISSDKQRLQMVRQRQKQNQQFRKQLYKQKLKQNSAKSLKAEQQILKRSQKIKTRDQISRKIIQDNKKKLDFLKNTQIKDHLQSLKYKIQKTQLIRNKQQAKKTEIFHKSQQIDLKRLNQQQNKKYLKMKYEQKLKNASLRKENQQIIKRQSIDYNKTNELIKFIQIKKNIEHGKQQNERFISQLKKNQEWRFQTASQNRKNIVHQTKLQHQAKEYKQQLAQKKVQSLNYRKTIEAEATKKKLYSRYQQIEQIEYVKDKLSRERKKIIEAQKLNQTININSQSYRPKFNSYFDN